MQYYSQEQLEFLRVGYLKMTVSELTKLFNDEYGLEKSEGTIQATLGNHKFRSGGRRKRLAGKPFRYTQEQLNYLRQWYKTMSVPELARAFNQKFGLRKTDQAIQGAIKLHGMRSGRKRGIPESEIKSIGSERVSSQSGFVWIKVKEPDPHRGGETRYKPKHKVVWEAANGPVPDGHHIRFLDGNKQNCNFSNLALFTRLESIYLNLLGFNDSPKELRETIILTARLRAKAKELESMVSV